MDDDVAYALGEVEDRANLEIFRLVSGAYDFDDRFRNERNKPVLLAGFSAKDGDVGSLYGTVGEANSNVEGRNASAVVIRLSARKTVGNAASNLLVPVARLHFPVRNSRDYLQTNTDFIGGHHDPFEFLVDRDTHKDSLRP